MVAKHRKVNLLLPMVILRLTSGVREAKGGQNEARSKTDRKNNPQRPYDPSHAFIKGGYAQTEYDCQP
jgi:hypothetical protein